MGPTWVLSVPDGPPYWPHEPCYQGILCNVCILWALRCKSSFALWNDPFELITPNRYQYYPSKHGTTLVYRFFVNHWLGIPTYQVIWMPKKRQHQFISLVWCIQLRGGLVSHVETCISLAPNLKLINAHCWRNRKLGLYSLSGRTSYPKSRSRRFRV